MSVTLLQGDCREVMRDQGPFDMIVADPPYGDTALAWDKIVRGWERVAHSRLKPTGSMWIFGSLRHFMATHRAIRAAGLRIVQEIVWEKHQGSGFLADRFRRVHELAVQVIRTDAAWADVFNEVQTTPDAVAKVIRRKHRPTHMGGKAETTFVSEDGGPRLMRSVIYARSCHGRAIHPTEKPVDLLEILIRTSCPPGGLVGDFFAGSGAAGDAAAMCGRRYVGCEIDPDYIAAARNRLGAMLPLGAAA